MAYATLEEVRALDVLRDQVNTYTNEMITEAIAYATTVIDMETATSWEYKAQTVVLDGNGCSEIDVGVLFVRAITSATIGGQSASITGWVGTPTGMVRRPTGTFPSSTVGQNVSITFTAGATSTSPEDIRWAARTLARWHTLQALTRTPSNTLQTITDQGTVTHVQPGGPYKNITALPDVNQVLRRRCHKVPGIG
ncbi:MAG: hypothetical protein ACKV2O_14700 [Acidimicrobiales bacterium]